MYLYLEGCKITLKKNKIDNSGKKKLDVKEEKKKKARQRVSQENSE